MTFEELIIKHGAASFDKQIYLQAMFGKAGWSLDLSTGVLAFRKPHEEPQQLFVQVLGTQSEDSGTWLWAWANQAQTFAPALLGVAEEVRVLGAKLGVAELTQAEIPCTSQVNGDSIAAVASGLSRAGCTFRAAYPRGAMQLVIRDPRFKRPVSQPAPRIVRAFPMFLRANPKIPARPALLAYLQFYRLNVEEQGERVRAWSAGESRNAIGAEAARALVAEFDGAGRLLRIEEDWSTPA
jgi:hypothetical protein